VKEGNTLKVVFEESLFYNLDVFKLLLIKHCSEINSYKFILV